MSHNKTSATWQQKTASLSHFPRRIVFRNLVLNLPFGRRLSSKIIGANLAECSGMGSDYKCGQLDIIGKMWCGVFGVSLLKNK